ncbi:MAG TPA: hypothetical protein VF150_02765 [Thermoanaerobaculia bacterium]
MSIDRPGRTGREGLALLVALLLLVGAPAPAQTPVERPEERPGEPSSEGEAAAEAEDPAVDEARDPGSYFASTLTLGTGRDEGFRAGGEELDDTVHLLRPSLLALHRPSARTELLLAYEPELQYFDRHSDLDSVDHRAGLLFQHEATRRGRVLAGGSFLDGEDPGRHLGGLTVLLPRAPYRQWRAYAGWEYRWQRTGLLLHYAHTATEIEPTTGVLAAGLDETEDTATVTLSRDLTPRTDLMVSYSWLNPNYEQVDPVGPVPEAPEDTPDDPAAPEDPTLPEDPGAPEVPETPGTDLSRLSEPLQTVSLGLGYRPTPRVSLLVTGGVLEDQGDLSYLGAAEVLRSGEELSFRIRYDRSLLSLGPSAAPGGAAPGTPVTPTAALRDTVTQAVTLSFLARPAQRLRWEQLLWASRTDLPDDETLDSFTASSRLVFELTRRLGAFVQGDYLDQKGSDLLGEPVSRTFISVGLIVGLTGPRRAWGIREEPDALRRVLPYAERSPR